MPTLSLKGLLFAIAMVSIACVPLARSDIGMAKVMMVAVVISLLLLTVVGVWKRRPLALVVVVLSIGYLAIADGGNFSAAEPERFLPTELGLERCCIGHTAFDHGRRRSSSLTKWALAVGPKHKDWQYATQSKSEADAVTRKSLTNFEPISDEDLKTLDELLEKAGLTHAVANPTVGAFAVKLPVVTTVHVVTRSRKRDLPQNRSFFIVGHCLVVILGSMLSITYFRAVPKRAKRLRKTPMHGSP